MSDEDEDAAADERHEQARADVYAMVTAILSARSAFADERWGSADAASADRERDFSVSIVSDLLDEATRNRMNSIVIALCEGSHSSSNATRCC
jgi:hypothetical protein